MPSRLPVDDAHVIAELGKSLSRSGSGDGVSLHIDADLASQFNLEPGTEIMLRAYEVDGDVLLSVEDTPTGFTIEDFREYATKRDWVNHRESSSSESPHRLVYHNPSCSIQISMRSPGHLGDMLINNVTVKGEPVVLPDAPAEKYKDLQATAQEKDLDVRVSDSAGLWQQLKASSKHETDEMPDVDTVRQLVDAADTVTVQFVWAANSTETTLDDVGEAVANINAALDEFDSGAASEHEDFPLPR